LMVFRNLAVATALAAAGTPAAALDPGEQVGLTSALTMFYISIPLDSRPSRKAEQLSVGLQIQGKRDYQAVRIDSTMLNAFSLNDIDAKWMVGGLVTLGAIAAVSYKDRKTTSQLQQQQTGGGGSPAAPCPRPPSDPCKK